MNGVMSGKERKKIMEKLEMATETIIFTYLYYVFSICFINLKYLIVNYFYINVHT